MREILDLSLVLARAGLRGEQVRSRRMHERFDFIGHFEL